MKNKAFTLWQAVGLLAFMAVLAVFLLPVMARPIMMEDGYSCQSNLKQITEAFKLYQMDYDSKYPPISSEGLAWSDLAEPYLRRFYRCPAAKSDEDDYTCDYFYNSRLVGMTTYAPKSKVDVPYPAWTILSGDGIAGAPLDSNLSGLPKSWRTDSHSPAMRHDWMANYAFADGHVKALKPESIDDGKSRLAKDRASFAVR